ncbi:unnamed protein product [Rotaria socialis]
MGSNFCRSVEVNTSTRPDNIYEPENVESVWYDVCREGDLVKLLAVIPYLTNHSLIALILLCCGCDRNAKNKYGLTPVQETTDDTIRTYFTLNSTIIESLCKPFWTKLEDDSFAPNNRFIMGHLNIDEVQDAKKMMEAYRAVGLEKMYVTAEVSSMQGEWPFVTILFAIANRDGVRRYEWLNGSRSIQGEGELLVDLDSRSR